MEEAALLPHNLSVEELIRRFQSLIQARNLDVPSIILIVIQLAARVKAQAKNEELEHRIVGLFLDPPVGEPYNYIIPFEGNENGHSRLHARREAIYTIIRENLAIDGNILALHPGIRGALSCLKAKNYINSLISLSNRLLTHQPISHEDTENFITILINLKEELAQIRQIAQIKYSPSTTHARYIVGNRKLLRQWAYNIANSELSSKIEQIAQRNEFSSAARNAANNYLDLVSKLRVEQNDDNKPQVPFCAKPTPSLSLIAQTSFWPHQITTPTSAVTPSPHTVQSSVLQWIEVGGEYLVKINNHIVMIAMATTARGNIETFRNTLAQRSIRLNIVSDSGHLYCEMRLEDKHRVVEALTLSPPNTNQQNNSTALPASDILAQYLSNIHFTPTLRK